MHHPGSIPGHVAQSDEADEAELADDSGTPLFDRHTLATLGEGYMVYIIKYTLN